MSSRVLRRRSATAAWIYAAAACLFAGGIVAARVLGLDDFGVFATALVTVGFFQTLLDLTVEESLTKFGFRYVAGEDWGRLRRLFRQALLLKLAGGLLATVLIVALAPFADELFDADGVEQALLAAALLPLVQVVRERRRDGLAPAQSLRPAERLPGRIVCAPARRHRHRGAVRRRRGPPRDRPRAGDFDACRSPRSASSRCAGSRLRRRRSSARTCREIRAVRRAVEPRDGRHLTPHDARAPDPRRRVRDDPGRALPHRAVAADRARGCEFAGAPRAPHRADARLGEGRAVARILAGLRSVLEVGRRGHARGGSRVLRRHAVAHPRRLHGGVRGRGHGRADHSRRRRDPLRPGLDEVTARSRSGGRGCGS